MSTVRVEVSPQMRRALIRPSDHDSVTPRHSYVDSERANESDTVGNHVIHHVTSDENGVGGRLSVEEESNEESTAGEEEDTVPWETTTTDTLPETIDPIDFIESHPRSYSESALPRNGHLAPTTADGQGHRYENWSVMAQMEDGCRRGRVIKRFKASRAAQRERQRAPYPLPRQAKAKNAHPRPTLASRKRRLSGRAVRPPQWNASEGDMAQADEMGDGEGKDDGFVDCPEGLRRRNKKRPVSMAIRSEEQCSSNNTWVDLQIPDII